MKAMRIMRKHLTSLDDIVFEHRNKDYGCYYIRANYFRRLRLSFFIVLFAFVFTTLAIYFLEINPWFESRSKFYNTDISRVEYDPDLIHIINQLSVVRPDKPTKLILTAEPVKSDEPVERREALAEMPVALNKPFIPLADTLHDKLAEQLIERHKQNIEKEKSSFGDSISMVLEYVPQFPGGNAAIQTYFYRNQHYPPNALSKGIHGSTIVSLLINKKGLVEKARVVKGIDPELDMEAIRLVKSMPAWQPASYKGRPIACMLIIPVAFIIK